MTNAYDGFGRPLTSSINLGGTTRTLAYQHDRGGNRTRLTHPDNVQFNYSYDGLHRPVFVTDSAIALNHVYRPGGTTAGFGRIGASTGMLITPDGRLSILHHYEGSQFDVTWTFAHNPAGQVAAETRNPAYAWGGHYAVNRAYTANGLNQYSAAGGAALAYDVNGNLLSETTAGVTRSYGYDVENRLVSAPGGVTLRYDPLGRLYEVAQGGNATRFLYDGDALVAEYNAAGTVVKRYAHGVGADLPTMQYDGAAVSTATRRYLLADARGSIVAMTDGNSLIQSRNAYDEYGIPQGPSGAGTLAGRFGYTGQIWLPEIGMYHYKARVYSPTLGRFLQTDPIGYEDQFNLYAYVRNDPVNLTDPTGMRCNDDGTICYADTYDAQRSNQVTATTTSAMDDAIVAGSSLIPVSDRETFGYTVGTEAGEVQVRQVQGTTGTRQRIDPRTRQRETVADTGTFRLPSNASAGVHRHIDGATQGMDTEPEVNGGWGDSLSLGLSSPRPMYVIHGSRVGVRELVGGRLQFRMIFGRITPDERPQIQGDLNSEQLMFLRR